MKSIKFNDGEPCTHKGCLSHISHSCEGCGRINGKGIIYREDNSKIEYEVMKGFALIGGRELV